MHAYLVHISITRRPTRINSTSSHLSIVLPLTAPALQQRRPRLCCTNPIASVCAPISMECEGLGDAILIIIPLTNSVVFHVCTLPVSFLLPPPNQLTAVLTPQAPHAVKYSRFLYTRYIWHITALPVTLLQESRDFCRFVLCMFSPPERTSFICWMGAERAVSYATGSYAVVLY